MSEVTPLALTVRPADVLRLLGYPVGRTPPARTLARLDDVLGHARRLAQARGAYERLPVERAPELGLQPMEAAALVIGLVTAGRELEHQASEWLRAGDTLGALMLDAAGSAVAEEAADRLSALAVAELAGAAPPDEALPAPHVSCRISPGYGLWRLGAQEALFALLPHAELGVRLTSSLLMVPRKSVSFALWLGADARPLAGLSGCTRCELDPCIYRRTS